MNNTIKLEIMESNRHWLHGCEHELRSTLLGEMHARPFEPITIPRVFFHYAFISDETDKKNARTDLARLVKSLGDVPPTTEDKYWKSNLSGWELRWEEHTEFATYRWGRASCADELFCTAPDPAIRPAGKLLVATQIQLVKEDAFHQSLEDLFNPNSLCIIDVFGGNARVATDFQMDLTGHTRILVIDKGLGDLRTGILVQRILEIETYRTLALLGLPIARTGAPAVKRIENELADITGQISKIEDMESNHILLGRLTSLAAEIEAQVAETAFRFGAGRAYFDLVQSRLKTIEETSVPGCITFTNFFTRGLAPAIATCDALEKRQTDLSRRLVRTAELLRTRIQFELEHQNRDFLQSMDKRTKVQLRLQQAVEGLSVIAISYYAVGLVSYVLKGFNTGSGFLSDKMLTAFAVPLIVIGVWFAVIYLRRRLHD